MKKLNSDLMAKQAEINLIRNMRIDILMRHFGYNNYYLLTPPAPGLDDEPDRHRHRAHGAVSVLTWGEYLKRRKNE